MQRNEYVTIFSIFYSDENYSEDEHNGEDEYNDSGDCTPLPASKNIPPIRTLLYANTNFII